MPIETFKMPEAREISLREQIAKKLKRLAIMGITVSTLFMNACQTESSSNQKEIDTQEQESSFDMNTLKVPVEHSKILELEKIDHEIDSMSVQFFHTLEQQDLLEPAQIIDSDTIFSYKNWKFIGAKKNAQMNTMSRGFDFSWKSAETNNDGTPKEGYQYLNDHLVGGDGIEASSNKSSGFLSTLIHYQNPNDEKYSEYSYLRTETGDNEVVWQTTVYKDPSKYLDESNANNVPQNAISAYQSFRDKLAQDLSMLEK
ncbi:MAG: hypothetical protein KBB75_00935 [Candidatus Pacebacteria bacterium]|jgi:hypothetical protein|nr:hypothetical protein [Candidatus Paceibacterota bacterium]